VRSWQALSAALLFCVALLVRAQLTGATTQSFVLKPVSTLLVIAISLIGAGDGRPGMDAYRRLVVAGLVFSLAGDVFLMLPGDRFVAGLAAFLVAHLCYLGAFTRGGGFTTSNATALPLAAAGVTLLALLWPTLGPMRLPVLAYVAAILAMAWQALERSRLATHEGAGWAAVGAVLFVASDASLGIDRFLTPFPAAPAVVLGTYYFAQWMIATSVLVRDGVLAT